jgi:hypothetical protein
MEVARSRIQAEEQKLSFEILSTYILMNVPDYTLMNVPDYTNYKTP